MSLDPTVSWMLQAWLTLVPEGSPCWKPSTKSDSTHSVCYCVWVCVCESLRSRPTPCDPLDCSLPGSSLHGILLARLLDGLPFPSLGDPPNLGINPVSLTFPALTGRFFTTKCHLESALPAIRSSYCRWESPFFCFSVINTSKNRVQSEKNQDHILMCICGLWKNWYRR